MIFSQRENLFTIDPASELKEVLKELKHQRLLTLKEENITAPAASHHLQPPG